MPRTVIVEPGQCLEDIALQEYGSIDGVREVVLDNPLVFVDGFSTRLVPGSRLSIRDTPIDPPMFNAMRQLRVQPATLGELGPDPLGPDGDYNEDFNDDHYIEA